MLEEVTADTENLGAVEITVSVGVLVTTNDDVAGNETVSLCACTDFEFNSYARVRVRVKL